MSIDVNVQNDLVIVTESSEDITVNVSNAPGPAGVGVPVGGTTGQVLKKLSNTNYDTYWALDGGGVPYSGATGDVNLGEYGLSAGQLTLDTTPTGTAVVGTTRWNDTIGSSETTLKGGSVILKNGVDLVARVVNKVSPNTTLTKAAYQAVRISGAQGQRLAVELAQANNDNNSADTIGLVTETINANQEGFIMTVGSLENINTTGSLQGEAWADGDVLYLSPTTAGRITNVKPVAPQHLVVIGYVEYAHQNNGKIYVKVMNGWELGELHDVNTTGATNGQVLKYNGTIWVPSTDSSDNIYNSNGTLTGDRTLTQGGYNLNFAGSTFSNRFTSAGRLLLGTSTESTFLLDVNGTARVSNRLTLGEHIAYTASEFNINDSSFTRLRFASGTTQINNQNLQTLTFQGVSFGSPTIKFENLQGGSASADISTLQIFPTYSGLIGTTGRVHSVLELYAIGGPVIGTPGLRYLYINPATTGFGFTRAIESVSGDVLLGTTSGSVGIGANTTINASAIVDITSTTKGVLLPRMTSIQRTAISSPATGLFLYDTTDNEYEYYNGTAWTALQSKLTNPITGTGASGQVAYWNGTSSQTGSNNLFWDAANARLGIGTNTPGYRLHNVGTSAFDAGASNDAITFLNNGYLRMGSTRFRASGNIFQFQDNSYVDKVILNMSGSLSYFNSGGNYVFGGTTDSGQRLQVIGDAFIRGSGNTGATTALSIQNSDGTALFQVTNGQIVLFNTARTLSGAMLLQSSGGGNTTGFTLGLLNPFTATSGDTYLITNASAFQPTSGTGTYAFLSARPTINQTGGANGITRGVYVQPTLTAAADWRSIEWSNNSGWGLYGAGTAPNFLNGNLGLRTTVAPGPNGSGLVIYDTDYPRLSFRNSVTGDRNFYYDLEGSNRHIWVTNSVERMHLFGDGNLLLQNGGTFNNAGFRLDVNGTARVGTGSPTSFYLRGMTISGTTGDVALGVFNSSTTGTAGFTIGESNTNLAAFYKWGSAYTGNFAGSSIPIANASQFGTGTTNNLPLIFNGTPIIFYAGTTSTNVALRQSASTFKIGNVSNAHTNGNASAALEVVSFTQGFLPPRMSTFDKTSITSPTAGLIVFDTTLNKLCVYTTAWETITSI
jgi:hypothetical protein